MAVCEIDIRKITGSNKTVNVYVPEEKEDDEPYGLVVHWRFFAECPLWESDTSVSSYGGEAGISADTTRTVYIGGNGRDPIKKDGVPLPPRVGLGSETDEGITPSASVENFYDFNGSYVYSLVVV